MFRNRVGHRFSVTVYDRMIEQGILTTKDRVELIRGEIVAKMPIGIEHAACVRRINRLFNRVLSDRAIIDCQNPIILADSEPEPDIMLLRPSEDLYDSRKPVAKDTILIVEVADSSIEDDREVKGPLYAENGICEYWIVNLNESCLEVYRSPRANGSFRKKRVLHRGDQIEIETLKGAIFAVADLI